MSSSAALSAAAPAAPLLQTSIDRRDLAEHDVRIDIKYCGICHSDLHQVDADWGNKIFPMVPGHEIAGIVSAVGPAVTKFKAGDRVGVGVWVDSCGACEYCGRGDEQFCSKGAILTYNSRDYSGNVTYGGYSQHVVVSDRFVVRIPDALPLDKTAPLLCAGITCYTPLKRFQVSGKRLAIIGLGGLGHVGIKLARAMGADVTVLSRTHAKEADARRFGANAYYATTDPATFPALKSTFDLILNTTAYNLDMDSYLSLLRVDGAMIGLGLPSKPETFSPMFVVSQRRIITGSNTGNIHDTQEMLDFCGAHGITADIELIRTGEVGQAYERLRQADVRYRFVIDTSTFSS